MYEGHDWDVVTLPARVLVEWGVKNLYLTNAAGGLNPTFKVGDLMLLTGYRDHLNPRWQKEGLLPAIKQPPTLCENGLTAQIAKAAEHLAKTDAEFRPIQKGVYAALLGPSYETMAEIEMLKKLKCDAVGMSTVPELLAAKGSATTAAAISVVTNVWSEDSDIEGHEEVLRAAKEASSRLDKLFRAAISQK
jgi:purine-nucleoside phosphorylase